MGGGEGAGSVGVGESPAFHPLIGGIPMKKRVAPKSSPKKLVVSKNWKKSFSKYGSIGKKVT